MEITTTRAGRVLVADDDAETHTTLHEMLGGAVGSLPVLEIEVDSACQGDQAVRMVQQAIQDQRPYSVALVDAQLPPGLDGQRIFSRIWQVDPHIQTVICASASDDKIATVLGNLGASDRLLLLRKPIDGEVVRLMVRNLSIQCELRRQRGMQSQRRHADAMRSLNHLAAAIAHEINTPLQFVSDNVRFLSDAFGELLETLRAHRRLLEATRFGSDPNQRMEDGNHSQQPTDLDYYLSEIPQAIQESLSGLERISHIVRALNSIAQGRAVDQLPTDLHSLIEHTLAMTCGKWESVLTEVQSV